MAYSETRLSDWVKDDLPDLLWPLILVWLSGDAAARAFSRFQQLAIEVGGDNFEEADGAFDGRLTSLEAVPREHRARFLSTLTDAPAFNAVLPPEVLAVLRLYDDLPGRWLLVDPSANEVAGIDPDDAATSLARAMVAVVGDRHLNALVKTAPLGWLLLRGRVDMGDEADLLIDYPINEVNRRKADAVILSSFLSFKTMDEHMHAARRQWARSFWAQNWQTFECWPEELIDDDPDASEPQEAAGGAGSARRSGAAQMNADGGAAAPHADGDEEIETVASQAMREVAAMFNDFLQRSLDHDLPVDLYAPAKHEVVCGLASRCARSVLATLRAPHTWNGEHGMATSRVLAETSILLAWMRTQPADVYDKYQDYGRGKAKLMVRHMEELFDDDTPEGRELAQQAVAQMRKKYGGGDWAEEFQDVSVEATFSGSSLRQMALDAGMDEEYRHLFQPASGIAHGEWWALEEYAVQRCRNPLHLFHRIPSFDPDFPITVEFGPYLARMLEEVLISASDSLGIQVEDEPDGPHVG